MGLIPRPWTEEEWEALCDDESDGLKDSFRDPRTGVELARNGYTDSRMKTKPLVPVPLTVEDFELEVEDIEELSAGVYHIRFWYIGRDATPRCHDTRLSAQPCRIPDTWEGTDDDYVDDWMERRIRFYVADNKRKQKVENPRSLKRSDTKGRLNAKFGKK